MEELDEHYSDEPPFWAIFGVLMSGLVGVFVLLLVWAFMLRGGTVQCLPTGGNSHAGDTAQVGSLYIDMYIYMRVFSMYR